MKAFLMGDGRMSLVISGKECSKENSPRVCSYLFNLWEAVEVSLLQSGLLCAQPFSFSSDLDAV